MRRVCVLRAIGTLWIFGCGPQPSDGTEACNPDTGALPTPGSACAMEGQACHEANEDPCGPPPHVECIAGVWVEKQGMPSSECDGTGTQPTTGGTGGTSSESTTATTGQETTGSTATVGTTTGGGVACDPDNLPSIGTMCDMEGEYCSPGCEDPCQFCNIVQCTRGTWQGVEVFPAPCLECSEICPFTVEAMCAGGPPDLRACQVGCEDAMAGPCSGEFSQLRACAGEMPSFTCDAQQRPLVPGCEAQFAAYYTCAGL